MTREEAIHRLKNTAWLGTNKDREETEQAVDMAIEALTNVQNMHKGKWIKTTSGNGWNEWYVFKCPFCGATIEDKSSRPWDYNYCPSCGANMVKGGAI